jgi:UTP--glucose-1-phosphate uridylyltransferase
MRETMQEIKKAIFPIAGLATRFLPLSKALPKELLPLADRPLIQYLLEEAVAAGIKEVFFVGRPGQKKEVLEYLKKAPRLEKILKERKREFLLEELRKIEEIAENLTFFWVTQKEPLGDGHAVLQAKKLVAEEPAAIFFIDDVVDSKTPCLSQLFGVFKTCQRPVIALKKVAREELSEYGIVQTTKIASRIYKIKKIVEKPPVESAPSDLAILGRYIVTPEVFDYLKRIRPNKRGEIILADAFNEMAKDGKIIYGHEIEGRWLECGDKLRWFKSNFYFSLNHPKFGAELKKFLTK